MRQNNLKKDEQFHHFLMEISNDFKTVALIGLDRACGKTTTLKVFLEALRDKTVGVTSIGTDHQTVIKSSEDQRPIYITEGTVVATSRNSLSLCDTTKEILHTTGIQTPSGEIIVFRAKSAGHVFLAGPSMIADSIRIRDLLFAEGAEFVLIDGAADRKSSAYPGHSDAVVIAASIPEKEDNSAQDQLTREIEILTTPVVEDGYLREICLQHIDNQAPYFFVDDTYGVIFPEKDKSNKEIVSAISHFDKNIYAIYIRGALTNSYVTAFLKADKKITSRLANARIVAEDPTKLFISPSSRKQLFNLNIHIRVLKPIKILALSLNPCRLGLDENRVIQVLKQYAVRFELPVIDSMGGLFIEGI